MEINSLTNKNVVYATALKEKKYRDKEGKFLIEGMHLISMCDTIDCLFTIDRSFTAQYPVYYVTEQILKKISTSVTPQEYIAIANKKNDSIDYNGSKYLLLDHVSDPGNVGTIIRTAYAFSIDYVVLSENCVDLYNDKVIRGSQEQYSSQKINLWFKIDNNWITK